MRFRQCDLCAAVFHQAENFYKICLSEYIDKQHPQKLTHKADLCEKCFKKTFKGDGK